MFYYTTVSYKHLRYQMINGLLEYKLVYIFEMLLYNMKNIIYKILILPLP